jgi:hypothetical protein
VCRVLPWLWFPPPGSGQLRGRAGQLWECRVSLRLPFPPPGLEQLWAGPCPMGFSTHHPAQGSSGGSACPRGSRLNENRRADAEDLAEPGRCKATPIRSKWNRAQGAAADSYQIDPDPIYGGPAVAYRKASAACLATRGADDGVYRR